MTESGYAEATRCRERLIKTVRFQPVDALPFRFAYGLMPGVLEDWHAEGLPASVRTPEDVFAYFHFPPRGADLLPINAALAPPFEARTLEQTDEQCVAIDPFGRTTKVFFSVATLPAPVDYPVTDARTWRAYKPRLQFSPDRIGDDLEVAAARNVAAGRINSVLACFAQYLFRTVRAAVVERTKSTR